MTRLDRLITVTNPLAKITIQTAGHQGQLEVAIDLQGDGGRQGVHVEEIHAIFDIVFDQHPLHLAADESGRRAF